MRPFPIMGSLLTGPALATVPILTEVGLKGCADVSCPAGAVDDLVGESNCSVGGSVLRRIGIAPEVLDIPIDDSNITDVRKLSLTVGTVAAQPDDDDDDKRSRRRRRRNPASSSSSSSSSSLSSPNSWIRKRVYTQSYYLGAPAGLNLSSPKYPKGCVLIFQHLFQTLPIAYEVPDHETTDCSPWLQQSCMDELTGYVDDFRAEHLARHHSSSSSSSSSFSGDDESSSSSSSSSSKDGGGGSSSSSSKGDSSSPPPPRCQDVAMYLEERTRKDKNFHCNLIAGAVNITGAEMIGPGAPQPPSPPSPQQQQQQQQKPQQSAGDDDNNNNNNNNNDDNAAAASCHPTLPPHYDLMKLTDVELVLDEDGSTTRPTGGLNGYTPVMSVLFDTLLYSQWICMRTVDDGLAGGRADNAGGAVTAAGTPLVAGLVVGAATLLAILML